MNAAIHRPILDYLRDEYNITDVVAIQAATGGHSKLTFRYRDEPQTVTLPNSPGDRRWLKIKKGDIRRLLGPPPPKPAPRPKRNLTDMTAQLVPLGDGPAPPLERQGSVALRASNRALTFLVPPEVRSAFVANGGESTHIEFHKPDAWTIRHGPGPRMHPNSAGGMTTGGKAYIEFFGGPFPRQDAIYTLTPAGDVHVKLLRPVIGATPTVSKEEERAAQDYFAEVPVDVKIAVAPMPTDGLGGLPGQEEAQPIPIKVIPRERSVSLGLPETTGAYAAYKGPPEPQSTSSSMESDMRTILALAREIEAKSPYRLAHIKRGDDETLVWRAPIIE